MSEFTYLLKRLEEKLGRPLTDDEKDYAIYLMLEKQLDIIESRIVEEVMKDDKNGDSDLCGVR